MPRIFPQNPNFKSKAEKEVFDSLVPNLKSEDAVFCNLEISTPDRGEIEIDLLVLVANIGCVVIETKGGHITFDGLNWVQSDTTGKREIYPAQQVKKNMFAVRDFIRNRWSQGNLKTDWLVAFPTSKIPDINDKELPRSKIVDKSDLPNIFSTIKSNLDNLNSQPPTSKLWVDAAIQHLRAAADFEVNRESILDANLDYVKSLTHERLLLLDQIQDNDRYYLRGPAGSGKTWLAFEQAKRWTVSDLRVGIVAFNRGLTSYMQNKVNELPAKMQPAWIGTFHNFANFLGTTAGTPGKYDDENDLYASSLIAAAKLLPEEKKFDAFVVDEAQDFMTSWWQTLDVCLREPGVGKMALFGDDQQKLFGNRKGPHGHFAKFVLNDNIRNSRQIGELASRFTKRALTIRGPNSYDIELVYCKESEVIEKADDVVERLVDVENWQPGEVALLTTKERHPVHAAIKSNERDGYWQQFWKADAVFYGTVSGFKGLERPVVVLAINGFHNAEDIEDFLYVGITRARDKLIVVSASQVVRDLIKKS